MNKENNEIKRYGYQMKKIP